MLPVIISSAVNVEQESNLLHILCMFKEALRWTIADIKGISALICIHKIPLDEDAKPFQDRQTRLNPLMLEVVKKEVIKLLDFGVIYPIFDSKLVSPAQCVPKRGGMTVVTNEKNMELATSVVNAWHLCIDYKKLDN